MVKKVILFCLIAFLLLQPGSNIFPQRIERKDPLLAGVLSWYMPGLGQFYAGKYLKGSIFWVVANTLFISGLLTVTDINFSSNEEIGFQFSIKPKEDLSKDEETIGISLFIGWGLFHIYNIIDAIQTTRDVNLENKRQASLELDYKHVADNSYCSVNYKF